MGMQLDEQVALMVQHAKAGDLVVRLHSGDPSLYGAIVEQIIPLESKGVRVEIVPGVSSLFGAAASLGAQLTQRGISDTLIITRPAGKTLEQDLIRELSGFGATMAVFLGTEHLEEVLAKVQYPPATPAAVVYHATWPDEKIIRGTVTDIAEKARASGIERTALLIIGGVVDPGHAGHRRSYLYS
jgi:precorrin-4/cobalt-precorrin-4 C11-methyltransferase